MKTIGELIGNRTPTPAKGFQVSLDKSVQYIDSIRAFSTKWDSLEWMMPLLNVSTTLGIEVEVENIKTSFPLPPFLAMKIDQSLRNSGMEFTSTPLKAKEMYQALVLLWIYFDKTNKGEKPSFSWRTSNHLHIDVNSLTKEQFKNFLILGIVFEKFLFAMSGDQRSQSVFCVPFRESTLIEPLKKFIGGSTSLEKLISNWPKYTAMHLGRMIHHDNLGPGLGTVEFRHQSGTPKLEHLLIWITTILRLYKYAESVSTQELLAHLFTLNTSSHYSIFMKEVLSTSLMAKFHVPDFAAMFSGQVSVAKQLVVSTPVLPVSSRSSLGTFIAKDIKKKEEQLQREKQVRERLQKKFLTWDLEIDPFGPANLIDEINVH